MRMTLERFKKLYQERVNETWHRAVEVMDIGSNRTDDNVQKKAAYINAASKFYHPSSIADAMGLHRTSILHHIKKHDDRMIYSDYKSNYIKAVQIMTEHEEEADKLNPITYQV